MKRPYLLWKRNRTWYHKLAEGGHYLSTGQSTRSAAEQFVSELIHQARGSVPRHYAFRRYAEPFFIWDRCPLSAGCGRMEITRADVLELRTQQKRASHG